MHLLVLDSAVVSVLGVRPLQSVINRTALCTQRGMDPLGSVLNLLFHDPSRKIIKIARAPSVLFGISKEIEYHV